MSTRKLVAAILSGSLVLSVGAAAAEIHDSGSPGEVLDDSTSQPAGSEPGAEAGGVDKPEQAKEGDGAGDPEDGSGGTAGGGADEQVTEPDDGETASEANHGHAVSAVAHATPSGPGKGQAVSAVARSNAVAPKAPKPDDGDEASATRRGSPRR